MAPSSPGFRALALLVLLGSLWGLGFSLAKIATIGGVAPLAYSFWQSAGAGSVLSAVVLARGTRPRLTWRHAWFYLLMGITGFSIPNVIIVLCVAHLPVGIAAVVVPLSPLFTCAMAYAIGMEGLSPPRLAGLALGLVGTALIVLPAASLPSPDQVPWALLATATPMFYALGNIIAARLRPHDLDSLTLAAAVHVINIVVLGPVVLLAGVFHPLWPPFAAHDLAIMGQIGIACFGSVLFLEIVRLAGPVFLSQAAYIVTVTGMLWGMVLFGERHGPTVWAAMAAIFAGVLLVQRRAGAPLPMRSRG
jgi:drug/metabolite transporter (DMT)-like permease